MNPIASIKSGHTWHGDYFEIVLKAEYRHRLTDETLVRLFSPVQLVSETPTYIILRLYIGAPTTSEQQHAAVCALYKRNEIVDFTHVYLDLEEVK